MERWGEWGWVGGRGCGGLRRQLGSLGLEQTRSAELCSIRRATFGRRSSKPTLWPARRSASRGSSTISTKMRTTVQMGNVLHPRMPGEGGGSTPPPRFWIFSLFSQLLPPSCFASIATSSLPNPQSLHPSVPALLPLPHPSTHALTSSRCYLLLPSLPVMGGTNMRQPCIGQFVWTNGHPS